MSVVCGVCQTVNRDTAKFCRGCTSRLSVAPVEAGSAAVTEGPAAPPIPPPRPWAALLRVPPALRDVLLLAAVLVLLFAGFTLWYWRHSSVRQSPPRPAAAVVAPRTEALPVRPTAPKAPPAAATASPDPDPLTPAEAAILAEPPTVVPMPIRPPRQASGPARAAPPVRAASAAGDPLAPCQGRNVFARAICMNNQCAQPAHATHPQCVQVRRQRQLDEARRNLSD